jgi:hypothetical protein
MRLFYNSGPQPNRYITATAITGDTMSNPRFLAMALISTTLSVGGAAQAHHSVANYDRTRLIALSGTVKEFKYTNPHAWIYVMVPDENGNAQEWDLEGMSINMLVRKGWTRDTIKPGMKIKLRVVPRKDGMPGGEWQTVIELNGEPFALNQE